MTTSSARSLRTLSPSPRPRLITASHLSRSLQQITYTTTPKIGKDLRRSCLTFKRDLQFKEHQHHHVRCLTAPLPNYLRRSLSTNQDFQILNKNCLHQWSRKNAECADRPEEVVTDTDDLISLPIVSERGCLPPTLQFDSPGFRKALSELECPAEHSPNCLHPSPSRYPLYTPPREKQFLGRGSYGNVSLCKYRSHSFALKIIHRSANVAAVGELNILGIRHRHVVTVFKVTAVFDKVFVCMEFAGHHNLQYLLEYKTDLDFKSKLSFISQVASGLNHCHKYGIIHCDVKPANVIISPSGECKLGDFGLSIKANTQNRNIKVTGTAAYAAPEVLQGKLISTAADVYSFGIMLWQIYTNKIPFAGEHPHIVIYKVVSQNVRPSFKSYMKSNTIEQLAEKCWATEPSARPTSNELLTLLKKLIREIQSSV